MATQNLMALNPGNLASVPPGLQHAPRTMLLGLPCARCKAYYPAVLAACPICGSEERVALFSTMTQYQTKDHLWKGESL